MKTKKPPTAGTLTTIIHVYKFDISKQADNEAYLALRDSLRAMGPRKEPMPGSSFWGQTHKEPLNWDGQTIELETTHIFDDQWNTGPCNGSDNGYRLFDWAENIYPNTNIKEGYYLEQTEPMREIRRNTSACGYCGKQEPSANGLAFCDKCIGSSTLKEEDLFLLRMCPVYRESDARTPLTEAEKAHLMPLYVDAQIHGKTEADKERRKKQLADIEAKYEKALISANNEHHGMMYLYRNGINLDNVIYYSHTGRFGFGWRKPIGPEEWARLADVLCDFPCAYDVETSFDGVKSGE